MTYYAPFNLCYKHLTTTFLSLKHPRVCSDMDLGGYEQPIGYPWTFPHPHPDLQTDLTARDKLQGTGRSR